MTSTDPTDVDAASTITAILAAAQLTVDADEKATMINDWPTIRAGADAMYLPELESCEPAVKFDPTDYYAD